MTEREQLLEILTFVQRLSDENWHLLTTACRLMDDNAWVGPTARGFAADQQSRNRLLQSALQESVDMVRKKLSQTP